MKSLYTVVLIFLEVIFALAQNPVSDSLSRLIIKDKEDTGKITHLNLFAKELIDDEYYDSAAKILRQSIATSQKLNYDKGLAFAYYYTANKFKDEDDYLNAEENYLKALPYFSKTNDEIKVAACYSNLGIVQMYMGNYPKALDYYFRALKVNEKIKDSANIVVNLGNIASIYSDEEQNEKALEYYFKGLKISELTHNKRLLAISLGNIGVVYKEKKDYTKALDYYFKAAAITEELGNKSHLAAWYGNIANVYDEQGLTEKAREYGEKALQMAKESGNKNRTAIWLGNLGSFYSEHKEYKKGFELLFQALALSTKLGAVNEQKYHYQMLSELYENSTLMLPDTIGGKVLNPEGMRLRSLWFYKQYIKMRDSVFSEESKRQIEKKELNFLFEKKEAAERAAHYEQQALVVAESKKQKIISWVVGIGLLIAIVMGIFVFRSMKLARKQKSIIEKQKELVDKKNDELAMKQSEILDSIRYAQRIQMALITNEKYIERVLKQLRKKS